MNYNKLRKKVDKGEILSEKEVEILAKKLGIRISFWKIFSLIICILCLLIALITSIILIHTWPLTIIIISSFIIFFIFIYIIFKPKLAIINDYLLGLENYYVKKLQDFEGFETIFTTHDFQKSGHLQNKLCLFLTDGYTFFLFDDFLRETKYSLPHTYKTKKNKNPVLKVLDYQNINKRPIEFKLAEIDFYYITKKISNYKEEKNILGENSFRYTYLPMKEDVETLCIIELNDHSVFRLGQEAYLLLKKRIPSKERQ